MGNFSLLDILIISQIIEHLTVAIKNMTRSKNQKNK
jgi:hypothetical protein